jgi:hypothetical protein
MDMTAEAMAKLGEALSLHSSLHVLMVKGRSSPDLGKAGAIDHPALQNHKTGKELTIYPCLRYV